MLSPSLSLTHTRYSSLTLTFTFTLTHSHSQSHSHSHSHSRSLSLALRLTLTHSPTLIHTHTHSHSHPHSLSPTLTLTHTHSHSHSLTLTLTLTHTHSHSHSLSLTLTHTHSHSLSLSHSQSHSLTHHHRHHHRDFITTITSLGPNASRSLDFLLIDLTHTHAHTLFGVSCQNSYLHNIYAFAGFGGPHNATNTLLHHNLVAVGSRSTMTQRGTWLVQVASNKSHSSDKVGPLQWRYHCHVEHALARSCSCLLHSFGIFLPQVLSCCAYARCPPLLYRSERFKKLSGPSKM